MKKSINFIILAIICVSLFTPTYAIEKTTGRIATTVGLRMRKGPNTDSEKMVTVPYNTIVTIKSFADPGNGCDDKWAEIVYEVTNNSYTGYVCSTYIEDIKTENVEEKEELPPNTDSSNKDDSNNDNSTENKDDNTTEMPKEDEESSMAKMTDEEFEAYLTNQGFPESYKVKLRALHKLHPTWIFKGVKSNYTWQQALSAQNESGRSLYNVNSSAKENGYEGYLSIAEGNYNYQTDTFLAHDGLYWFQANSQTISYYMDPRNFLNESYIFMFEDLLYDPSYQNASTVNKILISAFMQQFTPHFMTAAQTYNVSPMYLAALSRQEVGLSDTNIVTNGKAGVLSDGVDYTGFYNFYNIGASSSGDPKLKSLQAARSYNWNTQQKSIVEGAYRITVNYVQCGQYTSYFQKYNLAPTATKGIWHQYSTNVSAVVGPAKTTFNSYNSMGIIDQAFSFTIPIFDGMPESTSLPTLGNPNNWLKDLKVNGTTVSSFDGEKLEYNITIPYSEKLTLSATSINANAKIDGIGEKKLENDKSEFLVVVTAQNNSTRTYKINVTREEKQEEIVPQITVNDVLQGSGYKYDSTYLWNVTLTTNVEGLVSKITGQYKTASVNVRTRNNQVKSQGTIVTGDKVVISTGGEEKTLEVIIYGDVSGDGIISAVDLLTVQKHLLGYTTLLGSFNKAADVNKDANLSAVDLLTLQKYLLNYTNISQS